MNFERSDILRPILDNLEIDDRTLFSRNIAPPILTRMAAQGLHVSSAAAELIFQGFRDELTKRGNAILSEMRHVLEGAYIEDFDKLAEGLKAELTKRLDSALRFATAEFLSSTESIRSSVNHPQMPSETALSQHVEKLQPKLFAEIDLFCAKLHDSQERRMEMPSSWSMAGAEKTFDYVVVLRTRLGRVGYRDLNGSYRIRVEPESRGRDPLARVLTRSSGWKQPGDQGQDRYSIEIRREQRSEVFGLAVKALAPGERGAEVNPSAPEWTQDLVKRARQGDRRRPFRSPEAIPSQHEKHTMPQPMRDQVFISYSHRDKKWLEKLQTMLKPLVRTGSIAVWDDTKIKAGAKWKKEIADALAMAKVAVLLVSHNFLNSDFIAEHELPPLLNAAENEGLVVLWVYVSSCLYDETEIKDYQAAHDISKPLNSLKPAAQEAVLVNVCRKIKDAASPG